MLLAFFIFYLDFTNKIMYNLHYLNPIEPEYPLTDSNVVFHLRGEKYVVPMLLFYCNIPAELGILHRKKVQD